MSSAPPVPESVGILSPGEMGTSLGRTLGENGVSPVTSLDGRSAGTRENAAAAGFEVAETPADLVRRSDLVLSVVPSDAVVDVAGTVAEGAEVAGETPLFVEMNAIAPVTVEAIDDEFGDRLDVVDGCIIGPARDLSVATVYLSGDRAEDVAALGGVGLAVEVLGDRLGQASGLKLCYAGMSKGTNALALDLLLSARALDIEAPLRERYGGRLSGVLEYLDYAFPGTPKRAERRSAEMAELAVMFESLDLSDAMASASHDRLSWLGDLDLDTDEADDATEAARAVYDAAFGPDDG